MDDRQSLSDRIAELEAENAELRRRLAQIEQELQKIRGQRKKPSRNDSKDKRSKTDRRRKEHRKHPGSFRPEPPPGAKFIEHDVYPQQCSRCGCSELDPTGRYDDHVVADIPEPMIEWHRYRRHVYRCRCCQQDCQGRGDLELPGAHIGPRARLLSSSTVIRVFSS